MMLRFGSEFLSQNFDLKINIFLSFFSLDPVPFFLYPLDNYLKIFFFSTFKNFFFLMGPSACIVYFNDPAGS